MRLLMLITLVLVGCAHSHESEEKLAETEVNIGSHLNASRYSNIYFSGQPSSKDMSVLKDQGFTHVINLRTSKEYDEAAEKKKWQELGVNYTQIPLDSDEELSDTQVELIGKAVQAHRKSGKTLIHCSTGNRVGWWAGAHFYRDHHYSKEEAQKMARQLGMTSDKLDKKLSSYMKNNQPTQKR